jgi:predicted transposase/invertase (TIGR01784 family)
MIEKQNKIIPMMSDAVFKSVLQDKLSEGYLVDIISNITKIPKEKIKGNIKFRNSELSKNKVKEKGKVADLIIELQDKIINLEMNKSYYDGLFEKNDRYVNKIVDGNTRIGESYNGRRKVIQINFDNFEIFDERIVIKFRMMDDERGLIRSNYVYNTDVEIYHVNLKRIKEMYYNGTKLNTFERELLLMTLDNKEELKMVAKGNKNMEQVEKKISSLSEEEQMQGIYIKEEQDAWVKDMIMGYASRKGYDEGMEQGTLDGKKQVAINMIKNNMDDNLILKLTGLSKEDIKDLKNLG